MTERSAWPTVRLGEVLRRVERFEVRDECKEYPFAGTYSFARGVFLGERKLGSTFQLPKIQRIRTGDFVYCKIMAWEGAFGVVPKAADGCVLSSAFVVYAIDEGRIDPRFLDYFFRVPAHWQAIGRQSSGTNVRRQSLHPSRFERAEIPLPPLAEQQRIVARIEGLAALINEARALCEEASEATASLLDGCATRLLGAEGSPKWPTSELESLCSVLTDCDHRTPDYLDEGVPLLRPRDIRPGFLLTAGTARIAREEHELRCRRHLPAAGDIVYSRELSLGNAAMIPEGCEVSLGQGTMLMRADSTSVSNDYLLRVLNSLVIRQQALRAAKGAAHPHLNIRDIRAFRVPVPPLSEQRRIVAHLDGLQTQVGALKDLQADTAAELDALLPSILDRAFKGEL